MAETIFAAYRLPACVNSIPGNVKMEPIYSLSFGVEGQEPIKGTEGEIIAILETYPLGVINEVFLSEAPFRAENPELYLVLKRYVARRWVEYHVDGRA